MRGIFNELDTTQEFGVADSAGGVRRAVLKLKIELKAND
jgi:hypothetical protein